MHRVRREDGFSQNPEKCQLCRSEPRKKNPRENGWWRKRESRKVISWKPKAQKNLIKAYSTEPNNNYKSVKTNKWLLDLITGKPLVTFLGTFWQQSRRKYIPSQFYRSNFSYTWLLHGCLRSKYEASPSASCSLVPLQQGALFFRRLLGFH